MNQLFAKLPRDLQWEILVDFVGTHVVRNGKLIRKIVFAIRDEVTLRHLGRDVFLPVVNPTRIRQNLPWLYKPRVGERNYGDTGPFYVVFRGDKPVKFCVDARTEETIYCYRKIRDGLALWEVQFTSDAAETLPLPPFEKHSYPSYPYTAKKKRTYVF
jgi:hypothetical protein